jgi:predicted Zn-dependent protease
LEWEADALAVEETYAAGVDPSGIGGFFEKLKELHESEPDGVEVLFTTHPPTNERVQSVEADFRKLPPKRGLKKDSARFQRIKRKVSAHLKIKPKKDPDAETGTVT